MIKNSKKEIGIILIAIFFASVSIGQVSISPFYSLSCEKKSVAGIKDRIGNGIGVNYDLSKFCGIGLQMRNYELWRLNSSISSVVPLRTFSLRFYLFQAPESKSKYFFNPKAGILAGIGTPVANSVQNQRMRQDLDLLPHPYFFGVFIEIGEGVRLSPKLTVSAFLRSEALAGMIRNKSMLNENATTSGTISGGLNIGYVFLKEKIKK
jgi:hypothetical protein